MPDNKSSRRAESSRDAQWAERFRLEVEGDEALHDILEMKLWDASQRGFREGVLKGRREIISEIERLLQYGPLNADDFWSKFGSEIS